MMTRVQKLVVFASLIVSLSAPAAYAGVGVDLLGAATYSMEAGSTGQLGFPGGGVVLNFRLGSKFDLQLGGIYLTRNYNDGANRTMTMIDGLLGFKYKFGKVVTLNFGGYGNYILTSSSSMLNRDIGLLAGIGIRIPLGAKFGILLNPQFRYGLIQPTGYSFNEVVMLAGFTIGGAGGK